MELISLYIDGEASETERRKLEEHIESCETCASFLRAYTGISSAIEADAADPPSSLRENVMNQIRQEPVFSNDKKIDRSKIIRLVLQKYVPLAACAAIIILALFPLSRQLGGKSASDSAQKLAIPSGAPAPSSAPYGESDNNMPPPQSGEPGVYAEGENEYGLSRDAVEDSLVTGASPGANAVQPDSPDASEPKPAEAHTETGAGDAGAPGGSSFGYNVNEYFALIRVEGELPELLKGFVMFTDDIGLSHAFIPAETVEELAALGYGVEYHNKDSATAVVIYTGN